jgi:hypothetical protein
MASNGDSRRSGLPTAGGVLSIIAGVFKVIGGAGIAVLSGIGCFARIHEFPFFRNHGFYFGAEFGLEGIPRWLSVGGIVIGVILGVLGIVAIVGGISAIKRSSFGLSLAGAICAFIPLNLLGLLAIIFVSLSKREFEAGK